MPKTEHDGDCHYYSYPRRSGPEDGVCTCGFGLQKLREGDGSHLLSDGRTAHHQKPHQPHTNIFAFILSSICERAQDADLADVLFILALATDWRPDNPEAKKRLQDAYYAMASIYSLCNLRFMNNLVADARRQEMP